MLKKIENFIGNRKPSFFFVSAIIFFLISLSIRLFEASLFLLPVFLFPIEPRLIESFLSIINDSTNVLGSISLIYGFGLKIVNELNLRPVQTSEEERLFFETSEIREGDEIKLLKSYYSQVLRQSDISFTFSLVFAALGFIVIIFSIFSSNTEPLTIQPSSQATEATQAINFDNSKTWASVISGIVIEAVSALFFVQTNNARKTMIEFSDKIRLDRKLTEALELIEKIKSKSIQSKVKALLVLNFSGLNMKYDDQDILKKILEFESDDLENISHQAENPPS